LIITHVCNVVSVQRALWYCGTAEWQGKVTLASCWFGEVFGIHYMAEILWRGGYWILCLDFGLATYGADFFILQVYCLKYIVELSGRSDSLQWHF